MYYACKPPGGQFWNSKNSAFHLLKLKPFRFVSRVSNQPGRRKRNRTRKWKYFSDIYLVNHTFRYWLLCNYTFPVKIVELAILCCVWKRYNFLHGTACIVLLPSFITTNKKQPPVCERIVWDLKADNKNTAFKCQSILNKTGGRKISYITYLYVCFFFI